MLQKKRIILRGLIACIMIFTSVVTTGCNTTNTNTTSYSTPHTTNNTSRTSSSAPHTTNNTTSSPITKTTSEAVSITTTSSTVTTGQAVKITDYGAHSITQNGYENFDSSTAINTAIQYAKANNISSVDFGNGKYYAKGILLESNITYFSSGGAELIADPSIKYWQPVLSADNKNNIIVNNLTVNGNMGIVAGTDAGGSPLIWLTTCTNITVKNCMLYNNGYCAILLKDNCDTIYIKNNNITNTDVGICTVSNPSNNLYLDNNTIMGGPDRYSEGISIYSNNSENLAYNINITNNKISQKTRSSGIQVLNSKKVKIQGNTTYDCLIGIDVGFDAGINGNLVTVSDNVTIDGNTVNNCIQGIVAEMNNSAITNNLLYNIKDLGIQLKSQNTSTPIVNDKVLDNTITNINSNRSSNDTFYEPAIRLEKASNCLVDSNTISDTRSPILHYWGIIIAGSLSTDNTVSNNAIGHVVSEGYQIWINGAQNTTLQNNTLEDSNNLSSKNNSAKIYDTGTGTIIEQ